MANVILVIIHTDYGKIMTASIKQKAVVGTGGVE
jgi:hypothetical protein